MLCMVIQRGIGQAGVSRKKYKTQKKNKRQIRFFPGITLLDRHLRPEQGPSDRTKPSDHAYIIIIPCVYEANFVRAFFAYFLYEILQNGTHQHWQ